VAVNSKAQENFSYFVKVYLVHPFSTSTKPPFSEGRIYFQNRLGGPNLLIHGSVAGITVTTLGFLSMGWPTWHQACWGQMGFAFLKRERGSLLRSLWGSLTGL